MSVKVILRLALAVAALVVGGAACGDNKVPGSTPDSALPPDSTLSTAAEITAYSFRTANNAGLNNDVTATINGNVIDATVPFDTDVTALVATFTSTGASVKVGATEQASGTSANDFTSPVTYTVTALDGSTETYTVTVQIAASDAKAITAFSFEADDNDPNLTEDVEGVVTNTSITATVPFGTDVTALVATFSTNGASVEVGAVTQVSGETANDFTAAVDYVVTAADNSTETFTVTVTIAANTAKDLRPFQFLTTKNPDLSVNVTGAISGNQITAIVPFQTDISALVATFGTTGDKVEVGGNLQESGVTVNNFTAPVQYTVTAADNSTQVFTVTVINSLSGDKDITKFAIGDNDGIISGTDIFLTVPNGTSLNGLVPTTITITGASVSPGENVANDFTTPATYVVTAADLTTQTYTVTITVAGSSDKDITRFTINGLDAVIATTSPTTGTITLNMPNGTSLASLSPVVTITGVSVAPLSNTAIDFSNGPVDYVVTAADNTTKTYSVDVGIVNGNGTKLITSFTILGVEGSITNGAQSSTVELVLPAGTDLSAQTPTIVINASSISPPSRVPQDFTNPVLYTVTAADGSTRVYTVTVTTL